MTPKEWMEVCEWVSVRWPSTAWHAEQAVAYYQDLAEFDPVDVWAAVQQLYGRGTAFAPTGSQLLAAATDARRAAARPERQPLPASSTERMNWKDWTLKTYGREMSAQEVIEMKYQERLRVGIVRLQEVSDGE